MSLPAEQLQRIVDLCAEVEHSACSTCWSGTGEPLAALHQRLAQMCAHYPPASWSAQQRLTLHEVSCRIREAARSLAHRRDAVGAQLRESRSRAQAASRYRDTARGA